jgi:uncharacterized protein (TIGR00251 family)
MVSLFIKVKPGSFKNEIILEDTGNLLVKIREKPINGSANEYLIKFLSKEFKIGKNAIELEKGTKSRFKKLLLAIDQPSLDSILQRYKK